MTWKGQIIPGCRPPSGEQPPLCNTVRALRTAYRVTVRRPFPDFWQGGFPVLFRAAARWTLRCRGVGGAHSFGFRERHLGFLFALSFFSLALRPANCSWMASLGRGVCPATHIIHRRVGRCSGGRAMGGRQRSHNSNYNLFVMFFVLFKCLVVFIIFLVKTFEVVGTPGLLCMCVLKLGGGRGVRG